MGILYDGWRGRNIRGRVMGEREGLGCSECFLLFRGGTLELQLLCNLTGNGERREGVEQRE